MKLSSHATRARHTVMVVVLLLLTAIATTPAIAQARDIQPAEVKMAMYDIVRIIEKTTHRDSKVSDALLRTDPEVWRSMPNKQDALTAADFFRKNDAFAIPLEQLRLKGSLSNAAPPPPPVGSAAFFPNYPGQDPNYLVLVAFGLVTYGDFTHRSNGAGFIASTLPPGYETLGWTAYKSALYGAGISVRVAELACTAAQGIPAAETAACAAYAVVQGILDLASVPFNAANAWDAQIDSAELEAAYRNAVLALGDMSAHDDRQTSAHNSHSSALSAHNSALTVHDAWVKAKLGEMTGASTTLADALAAHDEWVRANLLKNNADLKKLLFDMLAKLVANQNEIIKLLKTPETRRPGWITAGY